MENTELQLEKWMQSSFTIKNEHVLKLRAAAHVDCSTRAQVVDEMDNEIYFALLNEYKKLSGHAALLNTSFNENGSPLVSSPTDAFIMFARTDLDIIVIDNYVLRRLMKRSKLAILYIIWDNIYLSTKSFFRQEIPIALVIVLVLFFLALIFAFLSFAPIISPFVYPLF